MPNSSRSISAIVCCAECVAVSSSRQSGWSVSGWECEGSAGSALRTGGRRPAKGARGRVGRTSWFYCEESCRIVYYALLLRLWGMPSWFFSWCAVSPSPCWELGQVWDPGIWMCQALLGASGWWGGRAGIARWQRNGLVCTNCIESRRRPWSLSYECWFACGCARTKLDRHPSYLATRGCW